jgi:hypothetical protein
MLATKHSAAGLVLVTVLPPPLHACFVHPVEYHIGPSQVHESVVIALPVDMIAKAHALAVFWSKGLQNHPVNEQHVVPSRFFVIVNKQVSFRSLVLLHWVSATKMSHPSLV